MRRRRRGGYTVNLHLYVTRDVGAHARTGNVLEGTRDAL